MLLVQRKLGQGCILLASLRELAQVEVLILAMVTCLFVLSSCKRLLFPDSHKVRDKPLCLCDVVRLRPIGVRSGAGQSCPVVVATCSGSGIAIVCSFLFLQVKCHLEHAVGVRLD